MSEFSRYRFPAPAHSFVVRLFESGDQVQGFVRQIDEEDDPDSYYPTEEVPAQEALELAFGRAQEIAGARVYVELDSGVEWNPAWGRLTA